MKEGIFCTSYLLMKEVFQKTNNVKEAITLKRWETHFTRQHFWQPTNLFHVPFYYS